MSRSVFVLAAALFAVGGVLAAWFFTREGPAARPPQRAAAEPGPTATAARPIAPPDLAPTPASTATALPEPAPAGAAPAAGAAASESIEALFDRAKRLADEQKDFKGAIGLFKQVVARESESRLFAARALFEIGCCLEQMSRGREAQEAFRMVVELYADQREPAEAARRRLPQDEQAALASEDDLRKRLAEGRVDLDLVDETLGYAAEMVRELTKVNIIIDNGTLEDPFDRRLTLRLWNATIAEALDRIVGSTNARWYVENGLVVIAGREKAVAAEAKAPPTLPAWEADIPAWKQEEEAMRTTLAATPVSLSLDDANLLDMAREIQGSTTKMIVVDDAVEHAQDKKVTFQVRELDPSVTLDLICKMIECDW